MRTSALAILLAAIVAGALLRGCALGMRELSPDEAASWAAARAQTIGEVAAVQAQLNPGKLAVYEIAEHWWIAVFGDGLAAMRALAALCGTVAILMTFWAARELFASRAGAQSRSDLDSIAAAAALLCAVSLVTIKYSRESRVYPLMLAANLAQVACFLRALRLGGAAALLGVAVLTAFSIAANFASVLTVAPELLWMTMTLVGSSDRAKSGRAVRAAGAIVVGAACLVPMIPSVHESTADALARGTYEWIKPVPLWEPVSLFSRGTGTFPFPLLLAAAAWGIYRGWRRARDATIFALLWMWTPPLALLAASSLVRPLFVERFLLPAFVPFLILAAAGICELDRAWMRSGALALVTLVSLAHTGAWLGKPHDAEWREATSVAAASSPRDPITALPKYAIEVVKYYLPESERNRAQRYDADGVSAPIAIIADSGVAPAALGEVAARYPHLVKSLRGVSVRAR